MKLKFKILGKRISLKVDIRDSIIEFEIERVEINFEIRNSKREGI
jgi:hypothetical protein